LLYVDVHFFLFLSVASVKHCNEIASLRRHLQRIAKKRVLFLDESSLSLSCISSHTLVAPGNQPYILTTDNTDYANRYDMIGIITTQGVLPPVLYTPKDRQEAGVKGITSNLFLNAFRNLLAQCIGSIDDYPLVLVLDRASIHQSDELLQVLHEWGAQNVVDIIKMPTQAAKRMSPLDNALFHEWKELCRNKEIIEKQNVVQIMSDSWNSITPQHIHSYYEHCGLMPSTNPYFDCPFPSVHQHRH
jgi:hypothetical protein